MSRFRGDEMVSGKLVNRQDVLIDDLERQLEEAREENAELLIKLKAYKEEALKVSKNLRFKMLD